MTKLVNFRDNQEVPAEDLSNIGGFIQEASDQFLRDAVTAEARYAGFSVTENGATSVDVAPGRLFNPTSVNYDGDGTPYSRNVTLVYDNEITVTIPLLTKLPAVTKKIVAIVVWGDTIDTATEPRDFLINADTEETEPRAVATQQRRYANVGEVAGAENASPQAPDVGVNVLPVAYVTLNTSGIETIEMVEENRLHSVEENAADIDDLEAWREEISPRVDTISSDLADLKNVPVADNFLMLQLAADMARVKEEAEIPDLAVDYGADRFLTEDETDTADPTYNAKIEEGVRFAADAEDDSQLAIFDVYNPNVTIAADGFMLPAYTTQVRLALPGPVTAVALSQFQYSEQTLVKKTRVRRRVRYGKAFKTLTSLIWWKKGTYDARAGIFRKGGATFKVLSMVSGSSKTGSTKGIPTVVRLRQYWEDTVEENYWDALTTDVVVAGRHIGQTFLNSNDGYLLNVRLYFESVAATGDVHLALCETDAGAPDMNNVIANVTVAAADLKGKAQGATTFPIGPVFLEAGKRYAFIVTTVGNHAIYLTSDGAYAEGTYFQSSDGVFFSGDLTKDIRFALDFANFTNTRTVVEMEPLSLSGGIFGIDILAETIAPKSTSLDYQIQVDSVWHTISGTDASPLEQSPPPALVPFRIVFTGTHAVQAGICLSGSSQYVFRPKLALKHVSQNRTLAASSDTIEVTTYLDPDFDPVHHTFDVALVTPGPVTEAADTVTDVVLADGRIKRKSVFNLGAPVPSYIITMIGTTDSILLPFHVEERVDIAL